MNYILASYHRTLFGVTYMGRMPARVASEAEVR